MDRISDWLTGKFRHPLSLLFFTLGALLILIGVTTSLEVPVLQQVVPDVNFKWVSIVLGIVSVAVAVFLYYRPPVESSSLETVRGTFIPGELTKNFTSRRISISQSQARFLRFAEFEGHSGSPVSQDRFEDKFNQYSKSEIYYRLEHLRLLGFLEKDAIGTDSHGFARFTYRLSPAYRDELGGARGAHG